MLITVIKLKVTLVSIQEGLFNRNAVVFYFPNIGKTTFSYLQLNQAIDVVRLSI